LFWFVGLTQDLKSGRSNFEFLLRGKALGYVIIEDTWVRSFSAGGEIRLNDQFSLCADIVHFRWKFEKEVYPEPGNYDDYLEYALYDARNYIALEARYYPAIFNSKAKPYLNAISKIGGRFIHIQDEYPPDENEVIRLNSDFRDLGASLGVQIGKTWGFDVNMGAAYRWELKNEDIFQADSNPIYTKVISDNRWSFNIRVNFFLNLSLLQKTNTNEASTIPSK
jgi:hypothetical protein